MTLDKILRYLQSNSKIALLALVSIVSVALLFFRIVVTRNLGFSFMVWNLFLAWVPLFYIKWVWEREAYSPHTNFATLGSSYNLAFIFSKRALHHHRPFAFTRDTRKHDLV